MIDWIIIYATRYLGLVFTLVGCFFEFIAVIGVLRAKDFFIRAHIATVSVIGGTIVPLIGVALITLTIGELGLGRLYLVTLCVATSIFLLVTAPTGSHVLMRAAYIFMSKRRFNEEHNSVSNR